MYTTETYGIRPVDLEAERLLNFSFCPATLLETFLDTDSSVMPLYLFSELREQNSIKIIHLSYKSSLPSEMSFIVCFFTFLCAYTVLLIN